MKKFLSSLSRNLTQAPWPRFTASTQILGHKARELSEGRSAFAGDLYKAVPVSSELLALTRGEKEKTGPLKLEILALNLDSLWTPKMLPSQKRLEADSSSRTASSVTQSHPALAGYFPHIQQQADLCPWGPKQWAEERASGREGWGEDHPRSDENRANPARPESAGMVIPTASGLPCLWGQGRATYSHGGGRRMLQASFIHDASLGCSLKPGVFSEAKEYRPGTFPLPPQPEDKIRSSSYWLSGPSAKSLAAS